MLLGSTRESRLLELRSFERHWNRNVQVDIKQIESTPREKGMPQALRQPMEVVEQDVIISPHSI